MNKERIMEAMDYIDPALIEAADRSVSTAKHTRRGWSRIAVIAACLCLLLAGTALMAELSGVRIIEFYSGPASDNEGYDAVEKAGYMIEGGVAYFQLNSFSEEIKSLALKYPHGQVAKSFASWDDAETFIGMNLQDNPLLDDADPGIPMEISNLPMLGARTNIMLQTACDEALSAVYLRGNYDLGGVKVELVAEIFTEQERQYFTEGYTPQTGRFYPEGAVVSQSETYTATNSLEARTLLVERSYRDMECIALFELGGVRFTLSTRCEDAALAQETLFEILDAFVCTPAA